MLLLKTHIRASTTARIELQSYSTSCVQLLYFQRRGGSRCLFLNLNPTLIFWKGEKLLCFFPMRQSLSPNQKYFLEGELSECLFKSVHSACRAVRGGFLGSPHGNPLYVLPCAQRRRLGLEERFLAAAAVQDSGSCPPAGPHTGSCWSGSGF